MDTLDDLKQDVFKLMEKYPHLLAQHIDESQMSDLERYFLLFLNQIDREVSKLVQK